MKAQQKPKKPRALDPTAQVLDRLLPTRIKAEIE
jgi:hypothetical protein